MSQRLGNASGYSGKLPEGAAAQAVKNAEAAAKAKAAADKKLLGQRILNEAAALEKQLEVNKAAGISAEELYKKEMEILKQKQKGYKENLKQIKDRNSEAYKEMAENIEDTVQEIAVKEAENTKKQADEQKKRIADAAAAAKERRQKETEAIRAAHDAALELIKDNQKRELKTAQANSERQIADLQNRLESEKNLTAAAREAISKQIISIQEKQKQDEAEINNKYSAEEIRKLAADEQAKIELRLLNVKKGSDAEFSARQAQLEFQRDEELKNTELTENQKALIRAKYQKQIDENSTAQAQTVRERQAQALENDFNTQLLKLGDNERAKAQLQLEYAQNLNRQLIEIDSATKAVRFESDEAYTAAVIESRQKIIDAEKTVQQASVQTFQNRLSEISGFAGAIGDLMTGIGENSEEYAAFQKALALFNIAINTATAISGAISAATPGDPYTVALRIGAAIAAAIAGTAAALKSAKSAEEPKAPKFAQGGTVTGAGSGTSDSIPVRVSNGESIMTAAATSMFAPILSDLNRIGGGVPIQAVQTGQQVLGEEMLARAVAKGVRSMPNPVVAVSEIQTVTNRVQVLENFGAE